MDSALLLNVIKKETEKSTGCTDPGSVCLAVARAVHELKGGYDAISVTVSANVFKNGISVGIPGTGQCGLHMAAALGACLHEYHSSGLHLLDHMTPETLAMANILLTRKAVTIQFADTPDPLYVKSTVTGANGTAEVTILYDYSNIVAVSVNGQSVMSNMQVPKAVTGGELNAFSVEDIYTTALSLPMEDLGFLLNFARVNKDAAQASLADPTMRLGKTFSGAYSHGSPPYPGVDSVQTMTAAAGEARMRGLVLPIMAIAGSGNHGITNFLGTLCFAEAINADAHQTARALAISSAITIYIKGYIKRMTAFCGCSVAAATGVAAAAAYLLGGSFKQAELAMHSVIGTLGGLFCDGAKESCAYKLSTAASMAIQFAYMALENCGVPAGEGIIGKTIEDTFCNLGRLNNPGMVETDRIIVKIIQERIG